MVYTTGQTFKKGAVLIYDGVTGRVIEGGADPTPIVGIATEHADSKPGFGVGHASQVVATTGRVEEVTVAKANRNTVFSGRMVNGATDPVTPVQADVNKLYGLLKTGEDWVVDQADVTNTRVEITDFDADSRIVLFKFMEAHLAAP
jgi:hypothetical protein